MKERCERCFPHPHRSECHRVFAPPLPPFFSESISCFAIICFIEPSVRRALRHHFHQAEKELEEQQMTYDRAWGRGASGLLFLLARSSFRSVCASLYVSCVPIWHLLLGMSSPPPPPTSALQTPTLNCDR